MLHTTRAIVLRTIRHGDRSVVLKTYTERNGLRSYLVRSGGRSGVKPALLAPLARIDVVEDERRDRDLHWLRDARLEASAIDTADPHRAAVVLFTQELLLRVLKEEAADTELFACLHTILGRIATDTVPAALPIALLLELTPHLGFHPEPPQRDEANFDLMEGCFIAGDAPGGFTLRPPLSTALASVLADDAALQHMPGSVRRDLLDHLLLYFRLHVPGFTDLRSVVMLRQVMA